MFDEKPDDGNFSVARVREPGEPTTGPLDLAMASLRSAWYVDNINGRLESYEQAWDDRAKAIKGATGQDLGENPVRAKFRWWTMQPVGFAAYSAASADISLGWRQERDAKRLRELADQYPQYREIIRPDVTIEQEALDVARRAEQRLADVSSRYDSVVPSVIPQFAGGFAGSLNDPVNVGSFGLGPMGRVGVGAKNVLWMGVKQGATNAGVEALSQPAVQAWRREAGLDYGWHQAATNVGMAAAFGFGLDAGVRGASRGVRRGLGHVPTLDAEGAVSGWRRPGDVPPDGAPPGAAPPALPAPERKARPADPEAALDEAAGALPPNSLARKAAAGDIDAMVRLGKALGIDQEPEFRGARAAAEIDAEFTARMREAGAEDWRSQERLAKALRAAVDPENELPPLVHDEAPPAPRRAAAPGGEPRPEPHSLLPMAEALRADPAALDGRIGKAADDARALARLDEPAFRMVAEGRAAPELAAIVGEHVPAGPRQRDLLADLIEAAPPTPEAARAFLAFRMAEPLGAPDRAGAAVAGAAADAERAVARGMPKKQAEAALARRLEALDQAGPAGPESPRGIDEPGGEEAKAQTAELERELRGEIKAAKAAADGKPTPDDEVMLALRAYHGSPHDFDRFDAAKIGTGEGAQAYGYGLYFAESKGVAQSYRADLGLRTATANGRHLSRDQTDALFTASGDPRRAAQIMRDGIAQGRYLGGEAVFRKMAEDLDALHGADIKLPGSLFEVSIDVEPHQLLDWDKPLREQSALRGLAERELQPFAGLGRDPLRMVGGEFYRGLDEPTKVLRDAGIVGIRYLDAGSRSAGDGSRNIVIFPGEEHRIKIVAKNGQPVTGAERDQVLLALRDHHGAASVSETVNRPGFGTPEFRASRTFVIGGREVLGYDAAVRHVLDVGSAHAGPAGVAAERKAVILIGPPAAGKSSTIGPLAEALRAAVISADDAKFIIPEFKTLGASGVHEESSIIAKDALDVLYRRGANVILEKLGDNPGKILGLARNLRELDGYDVKLVSIEAPREITVPRILQREKATGRGVPMHVVEAAYAGIPKTLDAAAKSDVFSGIMRVDSAGKTPHIISGEEIFGAPFKEAFAERALRQLPVVPGSGGPGGRGILGEAAGGEKGPGRGGGAAAPEAGTRAAEVAAADAYVLQANANLAKTSRTAAGVVDTSASAGKADKIVAGLSGSDAAHAAKNNFERVIRGLFERRHDLPADGPGMAKLADEVALDINKGILKEGALYRTDDSPKYPYTAADDLARAHAQFGDELARRLHDPSADPVETAAWIEWRANLTDHFWADGVGKTSKALAAVPLMQAGLPLPRYRDNKEFFAHASRSRYAPDAAGAVYLDDAWRRFLGYYRTLMPDPGEAVRNPPTDAALLKAEHGLTPAAEMRSAELRRAVEAAIARIAPPDVRARIEDNLTFRGQEVDGWFDPHERLIHISLSAADPLRVATEEAGHALKAAGLLNDSEYALLWAHAERHDLRKLYKIDETYKPIYEPRWKDTPGRLEAALREETIMKMIAAHAAGERFGGMVDRILETLAKVLAEVRDALGLKGFRTVHDVFRAIETGEVKGRAEVPGASRVDLKHTLAEADRTGEVKGVADACKG